MGHLAGGSRLTLIAAARADVPVAADSVAARKHTRMHALVIPGMPIEPDPIEALPEAPPSLSASRVWSTSITAASRTTLTFDG